MEKQKNGELSRMFGYAGNYHVLTVLGCILSGISTILSMLPFVCIWLVIRDLIQAFAAGDISLATESTRYAWIAVVFAAASILIYFIALNCTHLAAFRTATNMRKTAIHHIVTLPLGYFSQNASGRLRKIIDDNAGLTEGFLAHQLPDLTGAVVMPVAVIVLIFLFDWRLGICCLIPGVEGKTENIRIISIVGRFLEHSRIYIFGNSKRRKYYIASADFMTRNTVRRVEVAAPVYDERLQNKLQDMFDIMLADNQKARYLDAEGNYHRVINEEAPLNSQEYFYTQAYHEL